MIDEILPWASLVALILSIGNMIWVFMMRGVRETADKVQQQEIKLTEHDRRIQKVEGELEHMPTKDELHELQLTMSGIAGKLERFEGELSSVSRTVTRIEEYLRETK